MLLFVGYEPDKLIQKLATVNLLNHNRLIIRVSDSAKKLEGPEYWCSYRICSCYCYFVLFPTGIRGKQALTPCNLLECKYVLIVWLLGSGF